MKNLIPILLIAIALSSGCTMPSMVYQRTNDIGQVYNVDARWWAVTKEIGKAGMTVGAFIIAF